MLRTTVGFLLFPFPAALLRALMVWRWPSPVGGIFAHPASMFVAMYLIAFLLELVFGVPIFLLMRRKRREGLLDYAAAGVAVLAVPFALVIIASRMASRPVPTSVNGILFVVAAGAVGGAIFRAVAPPRRADYGAVFA